MTELEFIESIDCRFPYEDPARCRELIKVGASISPNAAFMVLHEICRPPPSRIGLSVTSEFLQMLLLDWGAVCHHPLADVVLPAAEAMVRGEEFSVEQSLVGMRKVAAFRGQFNALSIAYWACDDESGKADALYQEIVDGWRTDDPSQ